jgi:hypothetical protein
MIVKLILHKSSDSCLTSCCSGDDSLESAGELQGVSDLLRDREFLKLLFGFGLGLGIFNAVTTVIEQLVKPCGYSSVSFF